MAIFNYLKLLSQSNSGQSSKAFAVVTSTIVSALMGITLCFAVAYDAWTDGEVDSDLQDMGILMLCMGGFVGGSSVSKIFGDQSEGKVKEIEAMQQANTQPVDEEEEITEG